MTTLNNKRTVNRPVKNKPALAGLPTFSADIYVFAFFNVNKLINLMYRITFSGVMYML